MGAGRTVAALGKATVMDAIRELGSRQCWEPSAMSRRLAAAERVLAKSAARSRRAASPGRQTPRAVFEAAASIDPASDLFHTVERGFAFDEGAVRPPNRHADRVPQALCDWAVRHGLASASGVRTALERARFHMLAAFGHADADHEGLLLTEKWCTWLFFQDDCLCDRHAADGAVLDPGTLARAHERHLAALMGALPGDADPLERSIHEIGREVEARRGAAGLRRFADEVRDYLWGTEWEALNRVRGTIPSVSAFSKVRPYAGAAYTAFQFWEIVEDFDLGDARSHPVARELRLLANNCISWANDLYSMRKEAREGNPNNLVLALAHERGEGVLSAMLETVVLYNLEYAAFRRLTFDLVDLGAGGGAVDLRDYARRLHDWILGNIRWSRLTLRYQEDLTMLDRPTAAR
jgi:hypothetical protein